MNKLLSLRDYALVLLFGGFANATLWAAPPDFETDVAPILVRRCVECHQGSNPSGGLLLTQEDTLRAGGDSGAVIESDPDGDHYLLYRVEEGEMPPPERGVPRPLPTEEAATLRRWVEAGAPWPDGRVLDLYESTSDVRAGRDWWSLQPVTQPEVPEVAEAARPDNPVDAFVRARLVEAGMQPAPQADRRTLLRRLYYDLIGLPPTQAQIEEFENDPDPLAWEKQVDLLLDSPQFGERWSRYWLDVVRFAETSGYERDQVKENAWKYRDWVVHAINSDKPYDEFVIEQLAGDEIAEPTDQSLIATGFLRLGTWNDEPNDPEDYEYERLEDLVHSTSTAFLGLTVKCARCHDHKFDPIRQMDYYRMAAIFWPGPIGERERKYLGGPTDEELGAEEILGWTDITTQPKPIHRLKNGERDDPLEEITPSTLSFIPSEFREFTPPDEHSPTTKRRLQMAEWIASPENPLTARVAVNRIWQHHFGAGLVRSVNNFGFMGDQPTHPQLLDWLAAELVENGWRQKQIHRLLLTSETYRQASIHPQQADYETTDAGNHYWWRAERRRLDAEALRDSQLAATGELDQRMGGESFRPSVAAEALEGLSMKGNAWVPSSQDEQHRRSLYIFMKRGLMPPLMTTFDLCDSTMPCGNRDVTTVAPQALALLNNTFVHHRAETLAGQIVDGEAGARARVQAIWSAILRRDATVEEVDAALAHVRRQEARFREAAVSSPESPTLARVASVQVDGLVAEFRADRNVVQDDQQRVVAWEDTAGEHDASQVDEAARPFWVEHGVTGKPAIRFIGQGQFLNLQGSLLDAQACTVFAVAQDEAGTGHREIISNWNGKAGNSVTSLFLGLTSTNAVRWSDDLVTGGFDSPSDKAFLLTATNGPKGSAVFQGRRELAHRDEPLLQRRLDTGWVIGQQGNIDGEFWHGEISEIRVYDRQLDEHERELVWKELEARYGLPSNTTVADAKVTDPSVLAWASLCVVLFNSNEFLYVD